MGAIIAYSVARCAANVLTNFNTTGALQGSSGRVGGKYLNAGSSDLWNHAIALVSILLRNVVREGGARVRHRFLQMSTVYYVRFVLCLFTLPRGLPFWDERGNQIL